jgi:hypothetical protein
MHVRLDIGCCLLDSGISMLPLGRQFGTTGSA